MTVRAQENSPDGVAEVAPGAIDWYYEAPKATKEELDWLCCEVGHPLS
jgi:hypothetical protein